MELLDIYDEQRQPTGRTHVRGELPREGDCLLAVHVWIQNSRGEYLISKRSPEKKTAPGMWECTEGMVIAGENSLQGALREAREELGIVLQPENGYLIRSFGPLQLPSGERIFFDVWFFRQDVALEDIVLQKGETCAARWSDEDELRRMSDCGDLLPCDYLEWMFNLMSPHVFFLDLLGATETDDTDIPELLFVVIAARYRKQWIFVRHQDRDTYEMPGGHIEPGEAPLEAAQRELYEESGAAVFSIEPICCYGVRRHDQEQTTHGMFYFAEVEELEDLPAYEIAERSLWSAPPPRLTYPTIYPALWAKLQEWLKQSTNYKAQSTNI